MNRKIKISIVNYTNTLPFRWALKKSELIDKIDLQEDIPSICAQKLKYRQVDLALVPVALLNELEEYYLISDFCIGTDGIVDSVKLYSNVPLNEIQTIHLDYQSKTSILLTKVLCRDHWKISPQFVDAKPGYEQNMGAKSANVVIGDRTFALNGNYKYEFDLGEEWKKMTGLPFVFAAWVSYEKLDPDFITAFNKILKHGVNNIEQAMKELKNSNGLSDELVLNYLSNNISYNFDNGKQEALKRFLVLSK